MFHSPHLGSEHDFCWQQFPKRLKKRPEIGKRLDKIVWGIHFVEGPHLAKVFTITALATAAGSLSFGILYWAFERDIGGAFTVASYITSLLTLFITAWQLWVLLA